MTQATTPRKRPPSGDKRPARDTGVGARAVGGLSVAVLTLIYMGVTVFLVYTGMAFWPPTDDPCADPHPCVVSVGAGASPSPVPTPVASGDTSTGTTTTITTTPTQFTAHYLGKDVTLDRERSLLLVVAIAGALGAMAHVLRSFYKYVGERHLFWSWIPSYFIMPLVGALFAIFSYVFIRAGLVTGAGTSGGNPFGFTAIAILVGLYTSQAATKFKQVFETIFTQPEAGSEALDSNVKPTITSIEPPKGAPGDKISLKGDGIDSVTTVIFAVAKPSDATWDEKSSSLTTTVPDGAETGPLTVSVGATVTTSSVPFEVAAAGAPFAITTVVPASAAVGAPVSLTGQGLETIDEVMFGSDTPSPARFDPALGTLQTTVPAGASDGPVSVSLDERTVTSATPFVVVPGGVDPNQPADGDPDTAPIPPTEPPLDDPDVPDDDPADTPTLTGFAPGVRPGRDQPGPVRDRSWRCRRGGLRGRRRVACDPGHGHVIDDDRPRRGRGRGAHRRHRWPVRHLDGRIRGGEDRWLAPNAIAATTG